MPCKALHIFMDLQGLLLWALKTIPVSYYVGPDIFLFYFAHFPAPWRLKLSLWGLQCCLNVFIGCLWLTSLICHHNLLDIVASAKHCAHFWWIPLSPAAFLTISIVLEVLKLLWTSEVRNMYKLPFIALKVAKNALFSDSGLYFFMWVLKQYCSKSSRTLAWSSVFLYSSLLPMS